MIKYLFLTFVLIGNFFSLNAQTQKTPFSFLGTNSSARASALSGAFVSLINDATGLIYNPALLYTVEEKKISSTFIKNVLDINSGNIVYIRPKYDFGVIGMAVVYNSYGDFEKRNSEGELQGGSFSGSDMSFNLSYANQIDTNFFYGATVKFLYTGLADNSTSSLAFDFGLLYKYDDRTNIGLSVLHSGMQLTKFNGEYYSLPLDIRLGFNHRLKGLPVLFNFSFHHLADNENKFFDKFSHFSVGGEIYFGKYLIGRIGYDNKIRTEISPDLDRGLSGFSGGIGIKLTDFNVDYSINQFGSSTVIHRFSLYLNY